MIGRIIEIGGDSRYLSLDRGFLVVSHKGEERGRTPIDDVAAVIGNAHGLVYSNNLLVALAERGTPFVLCGANHRPTALLWPVSGHHRQAARMDAQLSTGQALRKRLWKQIVQAKVGMQAAVIGMRDGPEAPLRRLVAKVRSGDPSNIEGQAARLYWGLLFGKSFRRDRQAEGCNAMLNYGYTVLRAIVARQVMAAGLHPSIPLHHANEVNAMRLVDDLMEPFRPLVDIWVARLLDRGTENLDPDCRHTLALLGTRSVHTQFGVSPVNMVVQRLVMSLAQCFEAIASKLELPACDRACLASIWDEPYAQGDHDEEAG